MVENKRFLWHACLDLRDVKMESGDTKYLPSVLWQPFLLRSSESSPASGLATHRSYLPLSVFRLRCPSSVKVRRRFSFDDSY